MSKFLFPTIECPGKDALREWNKLYQQGQGLGFYPVIVGGPDDLEMLAEMPEVVILRVRTSHQVAGQNQPP